MAGRKIGGEWVFRDALRKEWFYNMKKLILSTLLLLSLLLLAACGGQGAGDGADSGLEQISFVLEWEPNTNHTGVYVAQAMGFYETAGLSVEILTPPETGAAAFVASGRAQFGVDVQEYLGIELTLADPMPITAVAAIISHNNSGIISLKEKGIDDFSKLEGKSYASWEAPAELEILRQTMLDAGGDFEQLITIAAPATDAVSMISSGLVDAVWVYENWDVVAAELAGVEYNFLRFADASPVLDFYTPLIIGNNDFLASHPDTARRFVQATAEGYTYAINNPDAAAEILLAAVPELSADLIYASQAYLAGAYASEGLPWGVFDEARWTVFYDWMYEQGILPEPLGSQGFTNAFIL